MEIRTGITDMQLNMKAPLLAKKRYVRGTWDAIAISTGAYVDRRSISYLMFTFKLISKAHVTKITTYFARRTTYRTRIEIASLT